MAGQAGKFVLQFASTAILARLLTPEDFGIVAMVTAITGLAILLKDLGLTMATVQQERINQSQVSALFWVNLLVSAFLTVLVMGAAPLVARLYDEPRLTPVTAALGASLLLGGIAAQHSALIRRQMRFRALAVIEVASMALAIVVAVIVALRGGTYWALVVLNVVREATQAVATWVTSGWTPSRPRRDSGAGGMLRFGFHLSGFSIVNYIGRNIDDALIGWRWGPDDAGIYNRAYSLLMMPLRQINQPIAAVAIPVLSRLQGDAKRYRSYYARAVNVLAYATVPLIAVMGALSEEVIAALLGPGWEDAGRVFAILAIASVGQPVLSTAGWVWTSTGKANQMFRWALISDPLIVAAFAIGLRWGPTGVAVAYALVVNVLIVPGLRYAYSGTPVKLADAWQACCRPVVLGVAVFVGASGGRVLVDEGTLLIRIGSGLIGAVIASVVTLLVLPSVRTEVRAVVSLARELRSR